MLKLHMIIKTITNNDILTIFIEERDQNKLGIKIENPEKNLKTVYKLSMFDINILKIDIPPVDFSTTITMPSVYFQKLIRDMHNIAENIEIRNIEDKLFLSCKGEFCTQETVIGTENALNINIKQKKEDEPSIIQGVYSLKYIAIFTKCTNLCSSVEIFLKNNYPLVLKYNIGNLGEIKLALSQINED
jgi:proliferating cell nuclear antigen